MSTTMKGAEVAKAMKETLIREAEALKEKGILPCLTIIRVGARPDDLAYERGAKSNVGCVSFRRTSARGSLRKNSRRSTRIRRSMEFFCSIRFRIIWMRSR